MSKVNRFKIRKALVIVAAGLLLTGNVHANPAGRVMTSGKVDVYRNGELSQVLRADAPLPTDAVLKPEGNCGVRLENLLLVAKDGSEFGVYNTGTPVQLALNKGVIYFAVNQSTGRMVFETPAGVVTTQQFIIQAAADGNLKGFVEVNEGTTTLGVLEGGAMVVSTPSGEETIAAGNQIVLAQEGHSSSLGAGKGGAAGAAKKPVATGGKISKGTIAKIGGLSALAAGGGLAIAEATDDNDSSPSAASPATP